MLKVIMNGCNGVMGQVIVNLIKNDNNIEIVAGVDIEQTTTYTFPVYASIKDCLVCHTKADVIIDFSTAQAVPKILEYSREHKIPAVICTTGIPEEIIQDIKETSKQVPIFFSANMSIGVNLLINLAKKATEILADSNFDIEIIEKHHNKKIDAPSGTAISMANAINEVLNNEYTYKYDRSKDYTKREKKEIGIHSVRGGTIVGEHEIIFAGKDEIIELTHISMSKEIFAVGAIKACKYLVNKSAGLYNMGDLVSEL